MPSFLCTACGTQYPSSEKPPAQCVICEEERQYVPPTGQGWTTLDQLKVTRRNSFRQYEPGITGIGTEPQFGIGQRAILVQTPHGNILWDCIAFLDEATISIIKGLGGIKAIAISHPHFYTTNMEWSRAFNAPVYLHAADKMWVQNPHNDIEFWTGNTETLLPDVTLIRTGGHFPGGTVLHWGKGANGKGVVCAGDILAVTTDRKWVSFLRSYPNWIPLSAHEVEAIGRAMAPYQFETLYGHYFDRIIPTNAKTVVEKSVQRYLDNVNGVARPDGT
ncbi:MAG: MBL fold metallo-hydrolase [Pseudolabrys sp.]|nr:MBL fold metallo-hydrolase [Pseudolabrys sp.]MBV9260424.1 MBL fold metallo-hydrolase [Pseudolabrys sp.]